MRKLLLASAVGLLMCVNSGNVGAQSSDGLTPTSSPANNAWNYLWDTASNSWYRQRSSAGAVVVSGSSITLGSTLTVQAAAYATGNNMGGLFSLPGAGRVNNGTGLVQAVTAIFAGGAVPSLDLVLFNSNPTASTITDKNAVVINSADLSKIVGIVHITDATLIGTSAPSVIQGTQLALPYAIAGTVLYGAIITRSAVTPAATNDLSVYVKLLQD